MKTMDKYFMMAHDVPKILQDLAVQEMKSKKTAKMTDDCFSYCSKYL